MAKQIPFFKSVVWFISGLVLAPFLSLRNSSRNLAAAEAEAEALLQPAGVANSEPNLLVRIYDYQRTAVYTVFFASIILTAILALVLAWGSSVGLVAIITACVATFMLVNMATRLYVGRYAAKAYKARTQGPRGKLINPLEEGLQFALYGDTTFDYNQRNLDQANTNNADPAFGSPPPVLSHPNFWRSSFWRNLVILLTAGFSVMIGFAVFGASAGAFTGTWTNVLAVKGGFLMAGSLANPLIAVLLAAIAVPFIVNLLLRTFKPKVVELPPAKAIEAAIKAQKILRVGEEARNTEDFPLNPAELEILVESVREIRALLDPGTVSHPNLWRDAVSAYPKPDNLAAIMAQQNEEINLVPEESPLDVNHIVNEALENADWARINAQIAYEATYRFTPAQDRMRAAGIAAAIQLGVAPKNAERGSRKVMLRYLRRRADLLLAPEADDLAYYGVFTSAQREQVLNAMTLDAKKASMNADWDSLNQGIEGSDFEQNDADAGTWVQANIDKVRRVLANMTVADMTIDPDFRPPAPALDQRLTLGLGIAALMGGTVALFEGFTSAIALSAMSWALPLAAGLFFIAWLAARHLLNNNSLGAYGQLISILAPVGIILFIVSVLGLFGLGASGLVLSVASAGILLIPVIVIVVAVGLAYYFGKEHADAKQSQRAGGEVPSERSEWGHKAAQGTVIVLKLGVLIGALTLAFLGVAVIFNLSAFGVPGIGVYAYAVISTKAAAIGMTIGTAWLSAFAIAAIGVGAFIAIMVTRGLVTKSPASAADLQSSSKPSIARDMFFGMVRFSPTILIGALWILAATGGFAAGASTGLLPLFFTVSFLMGMFSGNASSLFPAGFKKSWDKWLGVAYVPSATAEAGVAEVNWEQKTIYGVNLGFRWKYRARELLVFVLLGMSLPITYLILSSLGTAALLVNAAMIILGAGTLVTMLFRYRARPEEVVAPPVLQQGYEPPALIVGADPALVAEAPPALVSLLVPGPQPRPPAPPYQAALDLLKGLLARKLKERLDVLQYEAERTREEARLSENGAAEVARWGEALDAIALVRNPGTSRQIVNMIADNVVYLRSNDGVIQPFTDDITGITYAAKNDNSGLEGFDPEQYVANLSIQQMLVHPQLLVEHRVVGINVEMNDRLATLGVYRQRSPVPNQAFVRQLDLRRPVNPGQARFPGLVPPQQPPESLAVSVNAEQLRGAVEAIGANIFPLPPLRLAAVNHRFFGGATDHNEEHREHREHKEHKAS